MSHRFESVLQRCFDIKLAPVRMTIVRFVKRGATFEGGLRVLDPRHHAVLIRLPSGDLEDKTSQLLSYEPMPNGTVKLTYGSGTPYPYNASRVQILSEPTLLPVAPGTVIEVEGSPWINVVELRQFTGPDHTWVRVFSPEAGSRGYRTVPSDRVRILGDVAAQSSAAETLSYWSEIVDRLDLDSPLRKAFTAHHPHPDSALAHILAGRVIERQAWNRPLIFPFRCNLSQRAALNNALVERCRHLNGQRAKGDSQIGGKGLIVDSRSASAGNPEGRPVQGQRTGSGLVSDRVASGPIALGRSSTPSPQPSESIVDSIVTHDGASFSLGNPFPSRFPR